MIREFIEPVGTLCLRKADVAHHCAGITGIDQNCSDVQKKGDARESRLWFKGDKSHCHCNVVALNNFF